MDGARLLLQLSKKREDKQLALDVLPKVDLRDVQPAAYFYLVHSLAMEELDTSKAAFHILKDKNFRVVVPQHALTLHQDMLFVYMLMPTKEEYYLDEVIRRLKKERNPKVLESLITLLGHVNNEKGDDAIAWVANSKHFPKEIIKEANDILGFRKKTCLSFSGYESLKKEQQKAFHRVSDEALYETNSLLCKMNGKRK